MIVLNIVDDKLYGRVNVMEKNKPMPTGEDGHLDAEAVKAIIGCDFFDIVDLGHGISGWIDGEGVYKEHPEPNLPATALRTCYWMQNASSKPTPCSFPPLFGVVVLLGDTDEDGYQLDLTDEQVKYIKTLLG